MEELLRMEKQMAVSYDASCWDAKENRRRKSFMGCRGPLFRLSPPRSFRSIVSELGPRVPDFRAASEVLFRNAPSGFSSLGGWTQPSVLHHRGPHAHFVLTDRWRNL